MKNSLMILLAFTVVIFSSCSDEAVSLYENDFDNSTDLKASKSAPVAVDLLHFASHLEDENFNMPVGDETPLYNKNGGQHVPIMTPDGNHQVTLGEFKMLSGSATVKCINSGTHVVMHLKGLIPNGVYTIWTVTFSSPGWNGNNANRTGFGALGAIEGSKNSNSFKANDQGNASISVIRPEGNLLTDGSVNPHPDYVIPHCMGDVFETHLAIAYHLDNKASAPGAPSTWAVQGFFQLFGSQFQ